MCRAARYGNCPPAVFEEMEWEDGAEFARRVTVMYMEDTKNVLDAHVEMTKGIIKSSGARLF